MKTMFLSDGGTAQVVLTPENEFERHMLQAWSGSNLAASVKMGSFYECAGGWTRQSASDHSLIVRLEAAHD